MEKVKVLLATYNGSKYILDQLDSIINQKDVELDIRISDDGSNDRTVELIQAKYPKISVKQNEPGTGSAANNFLKMVSEINFNDSFEYIALSDQDDIWLPEKVSKAINSLKELGAHLYCSNLTKWDTSNNSYSILKKDFPQKKFDFLFEGGSAGCTYVFTRFFALRLQEFLLKVDFTNWVGLSHDWLIYFYARSRNFEVLIDNNSYINYRLHNENVHGHLNKLSWSTIKSKASQVFDGYHEKHAANYIKYLQEDSIEYQIYKGFLGGYLLRNLTIWKYNTQLIRDNKKFIIFALINLLKFK